MARLDRANMICGFCKEQAGDGTERPTVTHTNVEQARVALFYCNNCGAILGAATVKIGP